MDMPRKGCSTSKSLSPVIKQEAFAVTASSRNLLPFGSRQSVMVSVIVKKQRMALSSVRAVSRCSRRKYLPNFGRMKTVCSSVSVSLLLASTPVYAALRYARLETDPSNKKALINELVSKTKNLFFLQKVLKNFVGQTICFSFCRNFFKQPIKLHKLYLMSCLYQMFLKQLLKPFFQFRWRFIPLFCGLIFHSNKNVFHFLSFNRLKFTAA